jgi:hypothetical protein
LPSSLPIPLSLAMETWSRRSDLNRRPAVYETAALPTELRRPENVEKRGESKEWSSAASTGKRDPARGARARGNRHDGRPRAAGRDRRSHGVAQHEETAGAVDAADEKRPARKKRIGPLLRGCHGGEKCQRESGEEESAHFVGRTVPSADRIPCPESRVLVRSPPVQSNRTETTFEQPGSSMVTPYIASAVSIVRLLCVMAMN